MKSPRKGTTAVNSRLAAGAPRAEELGPVLWRTPDDRGNSLPPRGGWRGDDGSGIGPWRSCPIIRSQRAGSLGCLRRVGFLAATGQWWRIGQLVWRKSAFAAGPIRL